MADQYNHERIRRGLAVIVEEAPFAPEFDDLTTVRLRSPEGSKPKPYVVVGLSAATVLAIFVVAAMWPTGEPAGSSDPVAFPTTPTEGPTAETPTTVLETTTNTLVDLPAGVFPRVLLVAPDWTIEYLDHHEFENDEGSSAYSTSRFVNGSIEAELRLNSGPQADLDFLIEDRANSGTRLADETIWDTTAVVVGQGGSGFTAMWESNAVEYEFVAYDIDEETFRSLLSSLTQMPEQKWIAELPEKIIADRADVVPTYLEGVPIPPGLDAASLEEGPIEHWYPVAAETIGAVSCGWIKLWIDGKQSGDTELMHQAVDAMAGSRDWPILVDMSEMGDYSIGVWEYADAIAGDGTVMGGTVLTVEESYKQALGCA